MSGALATRLAELDWAAIERELDAQGCRVCRACSAKTCAASFRRSTRRMRIFAAVS